MKEALRLLNHLRQSHKIKDGQTIDKHVQNTERGPENKVHDEKSILPEPTEFSLSDFEEEGGLLTETKLERVGYCEMCGTIDSDNDEDQIGQRI